MTRLGAALPGLAFTLSVIGAIGYIIPWR